MSLKDANLNIFLWKKSKFLTHLFLLYRPKGDSLDTFFLHKILLFLKYIGCCDFYRHTVCSCARVSFNPQHKVNKTLVDFM